MSDKIELLEQEVKAMEQKGYDFWITCWTQANGRPSVRELSYISPADETLRLALIRGWKRAQQEAGF